MQLCNTGVRPSSAPPDHPTADGPNNSQQITAQLLPRPSQSQRQSAAHGTVAAQARPLPQPRPQPPRTSMPMSRRSRARGSSIATVSRTCG